MASTDVALQGLDGASDEAVFVPKPPPPPPVDTRPSWARVKPLEVPPPPPPPPDFQGVAVGIDAPASKNLATRAVHMVFLSPQPWAPLAAVAELPPLGQELPQDWPVEQQRRLHQLVTVPLGRLVFNKDMQVGGRRSTLEFGVRSVKPSWVLRMCVRVWATDNRADHDHRRN